MEVMFIVLPLAILMAGCAVAAFSWSVRRGQFDDLDTPRYRALYDDVPVTPVSAAEPPRIASINNRSGNKTLGALLKAP